MNNMNVYGTEGSNQSKNHEPNGYLDGADVVELVDVGIEVTEEVAEVLAEGADVSGGDFWDCLDDVPWGVIGAVVVAIAGIGVVIYKLIKGKKR